jgi:thiosulfate dehydrogenase [quinone] large subunit
MEEQDMSSAIISQQQAQEKFQPKSFNIMFVILRVLLGAVMLEAGLNKLIGGDFSISGYVSHGSGPFASLFTDFASVSGALSPLVICGEILVGLSLILGVFLRFGASWGAIMMILYYLPYLPPENGWISQQIIYMLVFITLLFSRSGYYFGIDMLAMKLENKWPGLRLILG